MLKEIINSARKIGWINFLDFHFFRSWYFRKENETFLELKKVERIESAARLEIINKKLVGILKHASKRSPYYRELFAKNNIDPNSPDSFKRIPFLTKDIIRNKGRLLLARPVIRFGLLKRNSGGSTGTPLEFYSDLLAGAKDNAHHRYLYYLIGYVAGDVIANSGGIFIPKRMRDKNIYWVDYPKHTNWGHIGYSALYLTDSTVEFYLRNICQVKPSILRGYPSFWNKIAEYVLANNIKFDFLVKGVVLTAERCFDEQKVNIEKAFSSRVYLEYGHAEVSVFGYTEDNTYIYKTSPLYGYVEVIKENGQPAGLSEEGEIVVTGFCNRGMPFIRYRTGDIGKVAQVIGGQVYFEAIQGRTQDYIISRDNQRHSLTALIFGQHFKAFRKISRWQLVQNEVGKVHIRIVKNPGYSQSDENEIEEKIKNIADVDLQFDYVDSISLTRTAKYLFILQNINKLDASK